MATPGMAGGVTVKIDPGEWYKLKQDLDAFDKDLIRHLRRRIRNAGNIAAEEVRRTLRLPSPDDGPDKGDGREALARATKVSISFTRTRAGTSITTSASKLPPENKGLLLVYNKNTFRHPVFEQQRQMAARRGNTLRHRLSKKGRAAWVAQKGRPYFGDAIMQVIDKGIREEIEAAVTDALNELARLKAAQAATMNGLSE